MQVPVEELRPYLQAFDFPALLVEGLGWDYYPAGPARVPVDGCDYDLTPAAEKSGFVVYVCGPGTDGLIPSYPVRRKIEGQVAKRAFEHLIIFIDSAQTRQVWQWVKREAGKPAACREQEYRAGQNGVPILRRLREIAFTLEEEGELNILQVSSRVSRAMDVERVTKRFYERFRAELTDFQEFIKGITAQGDREWYASLMLNRMMFVYFVQKQGFLDGDPDYLRHRLALVQGRRGSGHFQDFYREFLLRLFHEGLGQPEAERSPELAELLGRIPFLNGGLFDVHDLERDNPDISIPDAAFERVFRFFDGYRWHLDERPRREDNEINPDVLGYIFEKYVNQKQMGAYYTKEDITGYITRNTVIPFLFDAAKQECPVAFNPGGGVWRRLQDDPDRYIYPAVGHGLAWNCAPDADPTPRETALDLPEDIAAGLDDVAKRGGWNRAAPAEYGLPTETWREVAARRRRYREVREQLAAGAVADVNDLITLNLDIEGFARDVIVQSEGPELLRAFWHALKQVSVLDPTCGSGAFLFAALNILEPLYTACLEGMQGFLDDLDRTERPHHPQALSDFRAVLEQAKPHANQQRYFILKSIVLNNLYGVDIMEEAVEICKLRLFLKLMAQLERYDQIEPLPDIDFNIRAGNTLVGFTSLAGVERAMTITATVEPVRVPGRRRPVRGQQFRALDAEQRKTLERIEEDAEIASRAFNQFRAQQTALGGEVTAGDKAELRRRLDTLDDELNRYLAAEYGINSDDPTAFKNWRASHQPFHWFVEFYGIMRQGGFDVVVGNPPYVSTRKVRGTYSVRGLRTSDCPDIYSMVVERGADLCRDNGRTSMIVPLSLGFSEDFAVLRTYLYEHCGYIWFSSFGRIPSALFSFDTRVRNTIYLAKRSSATSPIRMTTRLHRWFDSERPFLFDNLNYCPFSPALFGELVPKLGNARLIRGLESVLSKGSYRFGSELSPASKDFPLHFKQTAYNWLTFCVEQPPVIGPGGAVLTQTGYSSALFREENDRDLSLLFANGILMYVWWVAIGDDFHLTRKNFASAPFGPRQLTKQQRERLLKTVPELTNAMSENVVFKLNAGKNIGNYNLTKCRHITDEVDKVLLEALGLRDLWEEIKLEHTLVVRTSYDDG